MSIEHDPEDPDSRVIYEAKRGDREACAKLITRHYQTIYHFCHRLSGNQHDACDLTQETFATVWIRLADFDSRCKISTWMCQIAYRKWIDEGRRRKGRTRREVSFAVNEVSDSDLVELAAIENEEQRQLAQVLQRLPEQERLVVVLFYQQGLTLKEISEITNVSLGTLKWRKHHALIRMQALVAQQGSPQKPLDAAR